MNKFKNSSIGIFALLFIISTQLFAQKNGENLAGKWQTEDNAIVEIFKIGNSFSIKQISSPKEKDKLNNGKIITKELVFAENADYKGIVIDPSNNKEYKGIFTVASDGKSLKLKVKWGFINFSEIWKKM